MRGYIARWAFGGEGDIRYVFSPSPKCAATGAFREVAEVHVREFNQEGLTIPSSSGGEDSIYEFTIEERDDGKFVVCCDAPFIVQERPGQPGEV